VHFHFERALEALTAGVAKIRLNPGNLADRDQVRRVIHAAGEARAAIRVGVNEGSIVERKDAGRHTDELTRPPVDLMVEKLAEYLEIFEAEEFTNLVLSAKSHDAFTTVAVNREIARRWDYPLHLGVTHAGTPQTGLARTAAALGALLCEGVGETIRVSFAGDPVVEIQTAKELLASLRLRPREGVELIACPTCGRLQMDLTTILQELCEALKPFDNAARSVQVAVMGCVVNGPGEAEQADVAICAGKGKAVLYRRGKRVRTLKPEEIVSAVVNEVRAIVTERA
jgi:(E)-4-hydroxy-3-methylbut-2-enyl-diphosphate synthase